MPPHFPKDESIHSSFSIPPSHKPCQESISFQDGIDVSQGINSIELMQRILKSLKIRALKN
jgi:hypothetical protein